MTDLTTTPKRPQDDLLARPLLAALSLDWEKTIYLLFVVVAVVTRFAALGSRVVSHDESLHTQFSYQYYDGQGYQHSPLMHGPFLFHVTAISYWLLGDSDFSARVPVALLGVLLILVPYFLRGWIGRVGALFASFIFLISPYLVYYSRYIRHDIPVIMWALIVVVSMWFYLRKREDKYLYWFAAGNALMFATKEVAFIYVAIFGSFLIVRLLVRVLAAGWLRDQWGVLTMPLAVAVLGVAIVGGGLLWQRSASSAAAAAETAVTGEGFAADPTAETAAADAAGERPIWGWVVIAGVVVLSAGLFLTANAVRPQLDEYAEFDLIILFTSLLLPLTSPLFTFLAGWNPRDYSFSTCVLAGQETMSPLQLFFSRIGQVTCREAFFSSGLVHTGGFLLVALIVGVLVGLWWQRRRWVTIAVIFHVIFLVLYTSVFTNLGGWASGMIGSLGYWLEQQEVQRGSQPWFYYFFVTTFYEFLPLIFSLLAIRLWSRQQRLTRGLSYWLTLGLAALFAFSFVRWVYESATQLNGAVPADPATSTADVVGAIAGLILFGIGVLLWFFVWRGRIGQPEETEAPDWSADVQQLVSFLPFLIWWLLLTWVAYTVAGEKMPWLSTHFVIPMAFLVGWYFNEQLRGLQPAALLARPALRYVGVTALLIIAGFLVVSPLWLGDVRLGSQALGDLQGIGRFLGTLLMAGGVAFLWWRVRGQLAAPLRRPLAALAWFTLLALLTIRFAYMAAFPNADYTNEFLVYAHGAPATKNTVLAQLEELSMRLYGDKSIKVAFSADVSWPFTWYLRDYPNRVYYGDSPSHALNDSPVVLVGRNDWAKTEPYLGNNYEYKPYTFLWWPMEEYRQFSWNALLGDPNAVALGGVRRGLGNPDVREALYNIFFYRDYQAYERTFGGNYDVSEWPLRHELRLYIRKDVLANLWDYGVGAVFAESLVDPYAEGEFILTPNLVLNEAGVPGTEPGQLSSPRNLAIGPDGRLYVADSGNHRIQVFNPDGSFATAWGGFGAAPGQLNEPWGIAVDDRFVYVADTWNHRIQKFTLDGELVGAFGQSGNVDGADSGLGLFFGPRSVALLPDNQLLVTDTGNHRMQILTRDGEFLRQAGGFGNQPGQLNEPVGLATTDDSVFLADTWNGRIQRFDLFLFPLAEWPVSAWEGQSINNKPYLAADSLSRIYVTDPEGYRVLIFTAQGDYLGRFGTFGTDVNNFALPNGIAIDAQNNIYVADAGNHRILRFAPIFAAPQPDPLTEEVQPTPLEEAPADEDANVPVEEEAPPDEAGDGGETAVSPTPTN
ncbi:MAG: TIGR03663 family protein [Anaerolineales bacterium]|nr:TIGR03663 family protein [Anaerolineales bacterium]